MRKMPTYIFSAPLEGRARRIVDAVIDVSRLAWSVDRTLHTRRYAVEVDKRVPWTGEVT